MVGLLGLLLSLWVPDAGAYDVLDEEMPSRTFERVRVGVGGFIQPRFRYSPDDPDAGTVGEIGFSLQRVRLEIDSDLIAPPHRRWGFGIYQKYSVELIPEPRLQDAYVNLSVGTEFQFRIGQFKAPIHRAILVSDSNNLFPDRSQVTTYVPNRELGFMFHGYWGERQVEWQAAIFNGEGQNRLGNVNRKFMYVGRVVFSPLGSPGSRFEILRNWKTSVVDKDVPVFSVGASVHYNVDNLPGEEEAYIGYNVEGFFHYRFITLMGEYFWKFSDFENRTIADFNQYGWYVQAGVYPQGIPWAQDHLALMGRVEQGDRFDPIDQDVPPTGPLDPAQATRRYSMGLGLYAGQPLFRFVQELRLVASYTIKEELEGFPLNNDEFNLSANLTF